MIRKSMSLNKTFRGLSTFLYFIPLIVNAQTPLARFTVTPESWMIFPVPLFADVENLSGDPSVSYYLMEINNEEITSIPCQRDTDIPGRIWWIPSNTIEKDENRVYILIKGKFNNEDPVQVTKNKTLDVSIGTSKILRYHHHPMPPPEGKDSLYTRSGFIHPIWTPEGRVLTRIHPMDHIHHMGLRAPWTNTAFE